MISVFLQLDDFRESKIRPFLSTSVFPSLTHTFFKFFIFHFSFLFFTFFQLSGVSKKTSLLWHVTIKNFLKFNSLAGKKINEKTVQYKLENRRMKIWNYIKSKVFQILGLRFFSFNTKSCPNQTFTRKTF